MKCPSKYRNFLKNSNPKSAEEAFGIILRKDYLNETCLVNTIIHLNESEKPSPEKTIDYHMKMPLERYPEFMKCNLKPLKYGARINKVVKSMNEWIPFYNKHVSEPDVRKRIGSKLERGVSLLITLTEQI